ncbi:MULTISPECIES: hypothetical protein [Roseivirga]|uniref:Uncharacterized protein n=1 Tax=Roseivirga echinicomitans TaxID=296218 RepID=A0A150X0T0_9BACT|nr:MULTISPECIES: hypothetical protein [Roseivirga]KYG72335.1 hypothetical protein AWN68_11230 [Roseivirga echinicomitans]
MKKKFLIMGMGLVLTVSLFAFNYRPDVWTYCIYSGVYVGGGEVPQGGVCVINGETHIEFQGDVDTSRCMPVGTYGANSGPCAGNGNLHADTQGDYSNN